MLPYGRDDFNLITDFEEEVKARILPKDFFDRPTPLVACDLLGKVLVHQTQRGLLAGKIVETEAYLGDRDPACHVSVGKTKRTQLFYEREPGMVYVFSSFGLHFCLNILTGGERPAGCVLIRAVEPIAGMRRMMKNRKTSLIRELASGPGKLTSAFGIGKDSNGHMITNHPLVVVDCGFVPSIPAVSGRVGVSKAAHYPLRYFLSESEHVSRRVSPSRDRPAVD